MKRIVFLLFLLSCFSLSRAANFPKVSTASQEYWYYLKFAKGTLVVASNGEGAVCKALIPTGKGYQLWKVEGSATAGYTFTNKLGLSLYVSGTTQGSEVRATSAPSSLNRFRINTSGAYYTVTPYSNTEQAFNVWGGMGFRNDIKLYNSSDANAPMEFVPEEDLADEIKIVPYPSSLIRKEGTLNLHDLTAITCFNDSTTMLARRLADDLQRTAGIVYEVQGAGSNGQDVSNLLTMMLDESIGIEAYKLTVTANGIEVRASDYGGFFNALQTLRQLMPAAIFGQESRPKLDWQVPCVAIEDAPVMHHRGFHLDISRHFFDKAEVKKLLDMASVYKLNRFHWHLTDDQGWRVEISEYPLLTTVGAIRNGSLSFSDSSGNKFFDDTEYGRGCYYTLDDLREVVAYARERNIEIIPEIDMPGHMTACIVAYPELGCNPEKKIEVMTEGGISRDILNVGRPATLNFLKCVLGHLAEVFPYELIHIGGDECPTTAWESNADCARLIQSEGLSGVRDIQPWLVEQLGTFLRENYGKNVVVWDELLAHWNKKYATHPIVMSWRGAQYAAQAADKGFYSIMVPTNPLYFDYMQFDRDQLEIDCPYNSPYGTINTLENVYGFDPRSTVGGREEYVLGTQANLWTESCTSNREAEYQYYPRLLALSEIAWLPTAKKDFTNFYRRLQQQADVLQAKDITYAPHYFDPADLTPEQEAIKEAEDILSQTIPDAVGYPSSAQVDALREALDRLKADHDLSAFKSALSSFKSAPIVLPKADCLYKIVSASTYFRNRFAGSSLYVQGTTLALHYTQQTEPEEVWQFVPQEDGRSQVVSVCTGNAIAIPESEAQAYVADKQGSSIVVEKATTPPANLSQFSIHNPQSSILNSQSPYIPGVVNLQTGSYNLFAKLTGSKLTLTGSQNGVLCYPGTWRIEEITDYRQYAEKLVAKAERLLAEANPSVVGQPTEEALQYLASEVIAEGNLLLAQDEVARKDYLLLTARYAQFLAMKPVGKTHLISSSHYYLIRNLQHTSYYAFGNPGSNVVMPRTLTSDDSFRWLVTKNGDGTFRLTNKKTNTPAYVAADEEGQRIRLGADYPWMLDDVTTEQGMAGIAILDRSAAFSWHVNPKSWTYALLKPTDQSASIWEFVETDEEVPTGIEGMKNEELRMKNEEFIIHNPLYDLSVRRIFSEPSVLPKGVYISHGRKMLIK